MRPITLELARFVVSCRGEDLPAATLAAARRSLINYLGVTIGGGAHEAVEATVKALSALGGNGHVPLFGRTDRFDAAGAALANGTASAVLDFDSTQLKKTNIHPSGPVLPALFATAALRPVGGREFMLAYILGVEVACRIANVVFGGRNPGWHVTGAAGGVGAAAAVGRLLGLDEVRIVHAMGIAANQAGGLREMYGTMCKAMVPGRAAQSGLYAAFMAAEGFDGPEFPLEGGKGLARVFGGLEDASALAEGLGESFEIDLNIFKPYPCAIVTHATIDAAIALRAAGADANEVASVTIEIPPIARELAGVAEPATELECKFSLAHCAAVGLVLGRAGVSEFSEATMRDPRFARLRAATTLAPVEGFRKEEARLTLGFADGRRLAHHVPYALGSLDRPMQDADLAAKFGLLVEPVLGTARAGEILALASDMTGTDAARLALRAQPG